MESARQIILRIAEARAKFGDAFEAEDVAARYAAYGWHVQHVDWTNGGTGYTENVQALEDAIEAAKGVTDRPSFIKLTTVIGWPLPT